MLKVMWFVLLLVSGLRAIGDDFYWRGGQGNWSDKAHWVTTSGGNILHGRLPGREDRIFFDENSGLMRMDIVKIDLSAVECNDLYISSSMTISPKVIKDTVTWNIYGEVVVTQEGRANNICLVLWGKGEKSCRLRVTKLVGNVLIEQQSGNYVIEQGKDEYNYLFYRNYGGKLKMSGLNLSFLLFEWKNKEEPLVIDHCSVSFSVWNITNDIVVDARTSDVIILSNNYLSCHPSSRFGLVGARGRNITIENLTARTLYIPPCKDVQLKGRVVVDTFIMLGDGTNQQQKTKLTGGNLIALEYCFITGVHIKDVSLLAMNQRVQYSFDEGGNRGIKFDPWSVMPSGVYILSGEDLCNGWAGKLWVPPVLKFRTMGGEFLNSLDTIYVDKPGKYFFYEGLDVRVPTNEIEIKGRPDVYLPPLKVEVEGETNVCGEDTLLVTLTWKNIDDPAYQSFEWLHNGRPIIGADTFFHTTKPGIYTLRAQQDVCKQDTSVVLRQSDEKPSAEEIVLYPVELKCAGEVTKIGIKPVENVEYCWKKDGNELPDWHKNEYFIKEGGEYQVNIKNACGESDIWKAIPVEFFPLPGIPVLDTVAFPCDATVAEVRVKPEEDVLYCWYDAFGDLMEEDEEAEYLYRQVEEVTTGYVGLKTVLYGCYGPRQDFVLVPRRTMPIGSGDFIVTSLDRFPVVLPDIPAQGFFHWYPRNDQLQNPDSPSPVFMPEQEGEYHYTLEYISPEGCLSTVPVSIKVRLTCKFPEVITPNGDGYNDRWVIEGLEGFPENQLKIYDRAGREVYRAAPYQNDWDGHSRSGDILPAGAYFYKISGISETVISGMVSIVRN